MEVAALKVWEEEDWEEEDEGTAFALLLVRSCFDVRVQVLATVLGCWREGGRGVASEVLGARAAGRTWKCMI